MMNWASELVRRSRLSALAMGTLCWILVPPGPVNAEDPTTWILVRHADRLDGDDEITPAGEARAEQLAGLLQHLRVSAVYSTETRRTTRTAQPTADRCGLEIQHYSFDSVRPDADWFHGLRQQHAGQTVLMVGHSNTIEGLIHGLGGEGDFTIGHDEYDSLFVVVTGDQGTDVVRIRFGAPTPTDENAQR